MKIDSRFHRFTLKEMETLTDNEILIILLNDKIQRLQPYIPVKDRLLMIRGKLSEGKNTDTLQQYLKYLGKLEESKN